MFTRTHRQAGGFVWPAIAIFVALGINPVYARPPEIPPPSSVPLKTFVHSDPRPHYSLARAIEGEPPPGSVSKSSKGLDGRLRRLLSLIEGHFGRPVIISSGCRSARGNRRAGGARHSYHLRCMAADIKLAGVPEGTLLRFVTKLPGRGGLGTYCRNSIVHLDVGPRREWSQRCAKVRHRYASRVKYKNWSGRQKKVRAKVRESNFSPSRKFDIALYVPAGS